MRRLLRNNPQSPSFESLCRTFSAEGQVANHHQERRGGDEGEQGQGEGELPSGKSLFNGDGPGAQVLGVGDGHAAGQQHYGPRAHAPDLAEDLGHRL
jgi:hypothetical protein